MLEPNKATRAKMVNVIAAWEMFRMIYNHYSNLSQLAILWPGTASRLSRASFRKLYYSTKYIPKGYQINKKTEMTLANCLDS
jgi:hypothetical protein